MAVGPAQAIESREFLQIGHWPAQAMSHSLIAHVARMCMFVFICVLSLVSLKGSRRFSSALGHVMRWVVRGGVVAWTLIRGMRFVLRTPESHKRTLVNPLSPKPHSSPAKRIPVNPYPKKP